MTLPAVLDIQLLGGLQINYDHAPITGFVSNKAIALFVYLAVTRRTHQREALATLLWGELPEADARSNLRQALANLRKLVGPYLIISRDSLAFNLTAPSNLDSLTFEQQLRAARGRPVASQLQTLQETADLYQGDFLAGLSVRDAPEFEEWMLAQRIHYRELAIYNLHTLTQHYLEQGQYGRAIDNATRLLALDAWREETHRQLMLAQIRSGQRSAALAQYETCRRLLQKELGIKPSLETTKLYERVRDARRIIHLPPATTPFVGRVGELAQIAHWLADPTCWLVTLSGPGGCGKTRLALEAAAQATNAFLHGVCFVSLAAIQSLEVVPGTVSEALGLTLNGKADPRNQLATYLSDKALLLVLDNLEHLAGVDEWLAHLGQTCPELGLLVTSRERLNLHGERLIELEGLDVPPEMSNTPQADYSATQLFLNSAREGLPTFALEGSNEWAVGRICRLVHGLPLAIELAAAWVRHLNCMEIADEIEQNLGFLSTTQKNVPERHRSLQAAFDHSWALLTVDERRAFVRLAVFRGGCKREAALAVTGYGLPVLAALGNKSLVSHVPAGRYTIHQLLYQYAENKLQADPQEWAEAKSRHCAYYLDFLQARQEPLDDEQQKSSRREIAAEIDNVRAAWNWAIIQQQPALLVSAMESLRLFFEHVGWYGEAAGLFAAASDMVEVCSGRDSLAFAQLSARQGWFYHRLDRFEEARRLIQVSLTIFDSARPELPAEKALCLQCLGNMARAAGDFTQSVAYFQQSLVHHRTIGNPRHLASSLNGLAVAHTERGDFAAAYQLHQESLTLRRTIGDKHGLATTLVNLGFLALGQGHYSEAKPLEQEALTIFREIGYPMGEAVALNNWGVACWRSEEYDEAQSLLQECLDICRTLGHRHIAAHALGSLGCVVARLGDYDEAWRNTHEGLQIAQEIGSLSATLFGLMSAAVLLAGQRQPERSVELAALVYHHPSTNRETKDWAAQLMTQLAGQLPLPTMLAAQTRGQIRKLAEAVAEI